MAIAPFAACPAQWSSGCAACVTSQRVSSTRRPVAASAWMSCIAADAAQPGRRHERVVRHATPSAACRGSRGGRCLPSRGACLLTPLHQPRMSSEFPARRLKPAAPRCRNSDAVRHLDDAVSAFPSLRASSAPALGRPAAPASAKNSQSPPLPRGLAAPKPAMPAIAGRARESPNAARFQASGNRRRRRCRRSRRRCSKPFHASCETHGSSARTSSSNSHQPFSSPKIEVMNNQGCVSSTITRVAAGPEQLLNPLERLAQVRRSMQHVRRDDHVERMRIEPLLERVALDIEGPALHERKTSELVLRVRDVKRGETSVNTYSVQCSGRTGRTKLVMPPVPPPISRIRSAFPFGTVGRSRPTAFCTSILLSAEARQVLIESLRARQRPFREDEVQRINLASQHRRQVLAAQSQQHQLGLAVRELVPYRLPEPFAAPPSKRSRPRSVPSA